MWLGIPKPMLPYPPLGQGVVRTVRTHLGRMPNCLEVPPPPFPPGKSPSQTPPPPGASGQWMGGGSWCPDPRSHSRTQICTPCHPSLPPSLRLSLSPSQRRRYFLLAKRAPLRFAHAEFNGQLLYAVPMTDMCMGSCEQEMDSTQFEASCSPLQVPHVVLWTGLGWGWRTVWGWILRHNAMHSVS